VAGCMTWAVRGRSSTVFAPSVWRGPRSGRRIALTFDDGPSESTPEVLSILERYGARATFFQCGANVRRLPELSRAVASAGHEVGNHGDTHARLWLRTPAFIESEVARAQEAIACAAGREPRLFRPAYGVRWFGLARAQRRFNLLGVMWTAMASDWRLSAPAIARKLLRAACAGAILCLHDGRERAIKPDIRPTLEALRRLLPELRAGGYEFTTVSELICPTTT
jgi:peptidoglycan/xylan/chitin deacetylase (PgdA/CDA1 family)